MEVVQLGVQVASNDDVGVMVLSDHVLDDGDGLVDPLSGHFCVPWLDVQAQELDLLISYGDLGPDQVRAKLLETLVADKGGGCQTTSVTFIGCLVALEVFILECLSKLGLREHSDVGIILLDGVEDLLLLVSVVQAAHVPDKHSEFSDLVGLAWLQATFALASLAFLVWLFLAWSLRLLSGRLLYGLCRRC